MVSSFFLSIIVFIYLCFFNLILILVASSDSESPTNLQDKFQEEYSRLIEEMSNKYPLNVIQSTEYKFPYKNYEPKSRVNIDSIPPLTKYDYNGIQYNINDLKLFHQELKYNTEYKPKCEHNPDCAKLVDNLITLYQTNDLNLINNQLNNRYSELILSLKDFSVTLPHNLRKEKLITSK